MTSFPASRRDFARQPSRDDGLRDAAAESALPGLPTPGPVAREILALFGPGPVGAILATGANLLLH